MLRIVSSEDISKVTGGDSELDSRFEYVVRDFGLNLEVGREVVDGLSEDTSPVDRVDSSEVVGRVEFHVVEEEFDDVLRNSEGKGEFSSSKPESSSELTWQSSKVPSTAKLKTFSSGTVVI